MSSALCPVTSLSTFNSAAPRSRALKTLKSLLSFNHHWVQYQILDIYISFSFYAIDKERYLY